MRAREPTAPPNDIVAAGYNQVALRYCELEDADRPWPRMRRLHELLARLPEQSDVLDVGCGAGVPATRAIAEQHRATGIDISENQIELARRNVPEARFVQGDVMQIGFPGEAFDAIVAFYVIEHVPREEHADLFARWARWLRPGGHLLFTIEPHDEPGVVGDWLGAPMFFSHFDSQKTLMLMQGAGFILVDQAVEVQLEKDHDVAYMWVLAQLRETGL